MAAVPLFSSRTAVPRMIEMISSRVKPAYRSQRKGTVRSGQSEINWANAQRGTGPRQHRHPSTTPSSALLDDIRSATATVNILFTIRMALTHCCCDHVLNLACLDGSGRTRVLRTGGPRNVTARLTHQRSIASLRRACGAWASLEFLTPFAR